MGAWGGLHTAPGWIAIERSTMEQCVRCGNSLADARHERPRGPICWVCADKEADPPDYVYGLQSSSLRVLAEIEALLPNPVDYYHAELERRGDS